jgi:hypothetical protein
MCSRRCARLQLLASFCLLLLSLLLLQQEPSSSPFFSLAGSAALQGQQPEARARAAAAASVLLHSVGPPAAAAAPKRLHIMTLYGLSGGSSPVPQLPMYLNYWVASCGSNAAIADCTLFVLMSDAAAAAAAAWPAARFFACRPWDNALPPNVRLVLLSDSAWTARVARQVGLKPYGTENTYKLADYKPLYGDIFDDYLPQHVYSHWAFADPDVIFGALGRFFSFQDDIYVTYFRGGWHEETASGQFTVLRNTGVLRHLWQRPPVFGALLPAEQDPWAILNKKQRLTYSEKGFGKAIFGIAAALNLTISHREESFTDESGKKGRFYDLWWHKGHVYAARACFGQPVQEGILIHMWALKKYHLAENTGALHNCSAWVMPSDRPWDTEQRWNYTHAINYGNMAVSVSEFHDPLHGHCSRPPCGCPKAK